VSRPPEDPGYPGNAFPLEPFDASFSLPLPHRKFQSRIWLHLALLVLTILSTTQVGANDYAAYLSEFGRRAVTGDLGTLLLHGLWYSGTILGILGAHEMGHYLFCRRHDVDATLPYFIPMPFVSLIGTMGAVIKIRDRFPTRRVLFDIGVAGPIAGFVVLVPALFFGLSRSYLVPAPTSGSGLSLGEPLLFVWATRWMYGVVPDGFTLNLHPIVLAAWFGMLATSWNLLPFGQFDGGHLTHAMFGRTSRWISIATVLGAIGMTFVSWSWLFMTIVMIAMLKFLGSAHPPVLNEYEPLPRSRWVVGAVAAVIFVICFIPAPLEPYDFGRPKNDADIRARSSDQHPQSSGGEAPVARTAPAAAPGASPDGVFP
jgi:membrane-associated protease RseP (regulator of RpoE activity)